MRARSGIRGEGSPDGGRRTGWYWGPDGRSGQTGVGFRWGCGYGARWEWGQMGKGWCTRTGTRLGARVGQGQTGVGARLGMQGVRPGISDDQVVGLGSGARWEQGPDGK